MSTLKEVQHSINTGTGYQNLKEWLDQHIDYLRGQLSIKWRLELHHIEVLEDIQGVMTPMVATISQLQDEMTACSLQLDSVVEEVTAVKQETFPPPHTTLTSLYYCSTDGPLGCLPSAPSCGNGTPMFSIHHTTW